MTTQTCTSTFAAQGRPAPRTQAGGRGDGGMNIITPICNSEDDGEAAAVSAAQAIIRLKQRIDHLLNVTEQCNVIIPSLREQRGNATLAIFGAEGGAM